MTLWHYTCDCSADLIEADGLVKPISMLVADTLSVPWAHLAWFTDLDVPFVDALGLTRKSIDCDRTEYRFRVTDESNVTRWAKLRRRLPYAFALESAEGAMPMHWWVSELPVPVVAA